MTRYEYKVVPAPKRGDKTRGVKGTEDRFALALTNLMNTLGAEGWEYLRADTLPCEERHGLAGRTTVTTQNMLIFRRTTVAQTPAASPEATAVPAPAAAPAAPAGRQLPEDPLAEAAASRFERLRGAGASRLMGPRLVAAAPETGPAPSVGPAKGAERLSDTPALRTDDGNSPQRD